MSSKQRVGIIGAGVSGLPCIRHALLAGYEVVCYEKQDDVGGLWRFNVLTNESSIMRNTITNTSKEMTAYSDFPPRAELPNFLHRREMLVYFEEYAQHFGLAEHIRFHTEVLNVRRSELYAETGQWVVTTKNMRDDSVTDDFFDFVMVASGRWRVPLFPRPAITGIEDFEGRILHSRVYKDATDFENKVVVVVGFGPSAVDIACEVSRVARKLLPRRVLGFLMARKLARRFDPKAYGIHPPKNAKMLITDELFERLATGLVVVKKSISLITGKSLTFDDNSQVANVDAIIFATGYEIDFQMIEDGGLIKVVNNQPSLHRNIFPTCLEKHTLAIIGCIQPRGPVPPVVEMQARYALGVFSGNIPQPTNQEMAAWAFKTIGVPFSKDSTPPLHSDEVVFRPYMDELAGVLYCRPPSFFSTLFSDPLLSLHLLFSPHTSYFYRIRGPHAWPGARDAILGTEERVAKGCNPSAVGSIFSTQNTSFMTLINLGLVAVGVILAILWVFAV